MLMPDTALLLHYIPRNTFRDEKSEEETTGIVKRKYKLLFKHHKELNSYVFFVLTSDKDACVKERTLSIFPNDWEHREPTCLIANCSYLDVQKHIVMDKEAVIKKASVPNTGFTFAGKVLQTKFSELSDLVENYTSSATTKTDFTIRDILKKIITGDEAGKFVHKHNI
ncbi:MAG: hypothetical protein NT098_05470 [Candidatus Parcubacteria bacterium]|nr:hypothetical protein [Candidatus Parcubacteria bacterium]